MQVGTFEAPISMDKKTYSVEVDPNGWTHKLIP